MPTRFPSFHHCVARFACAAIATGAGICAGDAADDPYALATRALSGGAHFAMGDFDGDGVSDQAVYDPATFTFYVTCSHDGSLLRHASVPLTGLPTPLLATPISGDFDGDGLADFVVFLKILPYFSAVVIGEISSDPGKIGGFGGLLSFASSPGYAVTDESAAVPICADFAGQGYTALHLYDPRTSSLRVTHGIFPGQFRQGGTIQFGQGILAGGNPIPVVGDFNGDGKSDFAVFEPSTSTFGILFNVDEVALAVESGGDYVRTERAYALQFGRGTNDGGDPVPYVGAFDDPSITDIGVWDRGSSTFYFAPSVPGTPEVRFQFGPPGSAAQLLFGNYAGGDTADLGIFLPDSAVFAIAPTPIGSGPAPYARQFGPAPRALRISGPPPSPRNLPYHRRSNG